MPKPGSSPWGAVGFTSPAPRGRVKRVCRGCVRLTPAWGGERVILGRSGSQGRAPLGTALISELFPNQGRATIPAEERRQLCTQVLCSGVAAAAGFSPDPGGQSRPPSRVVQVGSSPARHRGLALAHHCIPIAVSLFAPCVSPVLAAALAMPVPALHQLPAAAFSFETSVCGRIGERWKCRSPPPY